MSKEKYACSFESSVEHLLHTNIVPAPQEYAAIPEILVEPRKKLAALDGEIQQIEQHLAEIRGKREVLAADIDAHVALLSPIRRIPEDVLRDIFVSSVPRTRNAVLSCSEAPLLLCNVSSGWRNIALSTPRLWSSLHVVLPGGSGSRFQAMLSLAKSWIARSGILPLSLSIGLSRSWWNWEENNDMAPLLELLTAVSDRWEAIEFHAPKDDSNDHFSQALSSVSSARVPMLTRVKYNCLDARALSCDFLSSPSITSFAWSFIPETPLETMSIAWSSLTCLDLGSKGYDAPWTGQRTLQILQRCVNLEACTLVITNADPAAIPDDTVDLPRLTSLAVTCRDHTIASLILQRMRVPQLISFTCTEPVEPSLHLFSTVTGHTKVLRNLDITATFTRALWLHMMKYGSMFSPTVETIRISSLEGHWVGDDDILAFNDAVLDTLSSTALPALTSLTLRGCQLLTDRGVLDYVRGRAAGGAPLRFVDIIHNRSMEEDILPDLAALISDGLVISLRYELPENRTPPYDPAE
ncbi:hypothetical protein R3P38DRAFT_3037251, partial [Favolaschia claudopus]